MKYDLDKSVFAADINRLTNQLWKLIPMREHQENWLRQLNAVLIEVAGLNEILKPELNYTILLSKLEGLRVVEVDFEDYRKTVFESISLLREMRL